MTSAGRVGDFGYCDLILAGKAANRGVVDLEEGPSIFWACLTNQEAVWHRGPISSNAVPDSILR
jgi:hypothetical protein